MLRRATVRLLAALGALLAFAGCSGLERQLIFPGAATRGRPDTIVPLSPRYDRLTLTTRDGTLIAAQFGAALDPLGRPLVTATSRPTVIYFYGNGACLAYSAEQFEGFRRLGLNVLIPEYPGYGMSAGVANEPALYAAADAAYDHLLTRGDIDPHQIIAAGWSLGAAVAIDLASRRPVTHVVTISAFTSMPDAAHAVAPWVPVSWILRSRFDNAAKIGALTCPILIIHGTHDSLVPPRMAGQLAAHVTRLKPRRYDVTAAGHNDIFAVGGPSLWAEIGRFLAETPPK